jgi:hypothetical protein
MSNHTSSPGAIPSPWVDNVPILSLFFGALLIAMTGYFIFWGIGYTNGHHVTLFILATLFGVFMAFNIGGNGVANSFGTSVSAGTLTMKQALAVAAIFEVSGALIAGGEVTKAIQGHRRPVPNGRRADTVRLYHDVGPVGCGVLAAVRDQTRLPRVNYTLNHWRHRR